MPVPESNARLKILYHHRTASRDGIGGQAQQQPTAEAAQRPLGHAHGAGGGMIFFRISPGYARYPVLAYHAAAP